MTERYETLEPYINKRVTLTATFQKYGLLHGPNTKSTLLTNLKLHNITLDHLWLNDKTLVEAKLKTNQPITIIATIRTRNRPPEHIANPPIKDIALKKIHIIKDK